MRKIRCELLIDIAASYDDDLMTEEDVRNYIKQKLEENGYNVHSVEIVEQDCTKDDLVTRDGAALEGTQGFWVYIVNAIVD